MVMVLGYLAVLEPQERSAGVSGPGSLRSIRFTKVRRLTALPPAPPWVFPQMFSLRPKSHVPTRGDRISRGASSTRRLDIVLGILVVWELTRTVTGLTDA